MSREAPRRYHSDLRQDQARATRRRIRRAARELFEQQGFAATTIAEIAEQAGVSVPTIYATFGSKGALVSAMIEELEAGDEPVEATGPHSELRGWVTAHCALLHRGAGILRAARQALHIPEVAATIHRGHQHRRERIQELASQWEAEGALGAGLTAEQAVDRMWLLTTFEPYLDALDTLGWSHEGYRDWLADLLEREILGSSGVSQSG